MPDGTAELPNGPPVMSADVRQLYLYHIHLFYLPLNKPVSHTGHASTLQSYIRSKKLGEDEKIVRK